ncbi:LamG domain-containing protein [Polymorphospora rubra]|uniref:LamG domain-containing protein n=1 Tax=Polymorphospora rubra TaxID=338584 RepID=UPI0033CA3BD7
MFVAVALLLVPSPAVAQDERPAPPTITADVLPSGPRGTATFTFSTPETDVVEFRYGWAGLAGVRVPATGTTVRTGTLVTGPLSSGTHRLSVIAVDGDGRWSLVSEYEFIVDRPSPPVAIWPLETGHGVDVDNALSDQQPLWTGNTPLTPSGITWAADVRLIGAGSANFDGTSSVATAAGTALDTSGSFGVTAWLQVDSLDCTGNRTAVSADGVHTSGFVLGFDCATDRWWFGVADRDAPGAVFERASAPTPALPRHWTHLAGTYDASAGKLRLYVDGAPAADRTVDPAWLTTRGAGWDAGQIVVGRDRVDGTDGGFFKGQIVDLNLLDRPLVDRDLTGWYGIEPESAGMVETGIVRPTLVGHWRFEAAIPCYDPELIDCDAPDSSGWDRRLTFTKGAFVDVGHRGSGMWLDTTHWIDDPFDPNYGLTTQEYGRSQRNDAGTGEPPVWEDTPVLRTDGSFTVSTWLRLDDVTRSHTAVSQDSTPGAYSGFTLGYRPDSGGQWVFTVRRNKNDDTRNSVVHAPAPDPTVWTHLVASYDRSKAEVRLYVDGVRVHTAAMHPQHSPWQAAGPLLVGRGSAPGGPVDWYHGAIDDLQLYQGVLTDIAVADLHAQQRY